MNVKEKAKMLPASPGVYLMKDTSGHIIYVGKSKNLKNRVQSYMQHSKNHTKKVERLVDHLKDFDYILTDTEFEAFMLECKLIKEYQPIYNRVMKTPNLYTYVKIRIVTDLHSIELTESINEDDGNLYFGPYTSKRTIEKAIDGIKEFYKMNCNNPLNNHTPCFNYTLGLCMGICVDSSAVEKYHHIIDKIIAFLRGEDISILEEMEQRMLAASEVFDFEMAAKIREWIKAINTLLKKEKVIEFAKENNNIVVVEFLNDNKIKLFLMRGNNILFKQVYKMNDLNHKQLSSLIKSNFNATPIPSTDISKDEIDEAQIIYSYLNSNACEYFIVPEEWLSGESYNNIESGINELLNFSGKRSFFDGALF